MQVGKQKKMLQLSLEYPLLYSNHKNISYFFRQFLLLQESNKRTLVFVLIESILIYFFDLKFEFFDGICEAKISKENLNKQSYFISSDLT